MKKLLGWSFLLLLTACAGGAPFVVKNAPSSVESRLYVYRPFQFGQSATYPTVSMDGKQIGQLKNSGFLTLVTSPGQHNLGFYGQSRFQWPYAERDYPITTNAGKTSYYKLETYLQGRTGYSYSLRQVKEATALKEMASLKESK